MTALSTLLLLWLAFSVGLLILIHGRELKAAWRESVLAHPVLVVESDDWGPGPASDGRALEAIADVLDRVRDRTDRPAVMTLGMVLAVPDGPAILASGCTAYVRRRLDLPEFLPIVTAMREGCERKVFFLQRHGMEHYWPDVLLKRARQDEAIRSWLAMPDARTEALTPAIQSRWVDSARLPSSPHTPADIDAAIAEEAEVFTRIFGEAPEVAVPNTFVWDDGTENAWGASGVSCVITPGVRFSRRSLDGDLVSSGGRIRNGDRGLGALVYLVRNDYFEPIRGHRAERVWDALDIKVAQGRPVLLETHRDNFIAESAIATAALAELERALRGVCERYPDVRFMSSLELSGIMRDSASPLLEVSRWRRLEAYLCRVRCDGVGSRLLKVTGLRLLFVLAERLLGIVTRSRPAARVT